MSDLPTDLDTLLEAVEVMMGQEFADILEGAVRVSNRQVFQRAFWAGAQPGGFYRIAR